jgi:hypothetical protein
VSLHVLICLALMSGASPALAEREIAADVSEAAPFDAAELIAAIRVRLPSDGAPVKLRVLALTDGVRIEAGGNVRDVALRDLRGAAAARLVALAATDLLLDDLAVAPEPLLEPPSLTARHEPRGVPMAISVLGAASAWSHVLGGLGVDLSIPRGAWVVAIDAGGSTLVEGPVALTAAVVRLGGGARFGWFELRTGATFAPLFVREGAGDRTILAGANASARVRVPVFPGLHAVVAGGIDVFATRTTYLIEGMPALATPRSAPWIAAGVEMTP